MKKNKSHWWRNLCFISLAWALMGYLTSPAFLGFTVLPLGAAAIAAILAGPARWRADWAALVAPRGLNKLKLALAGLAALIAILAAGWFSSAPVWDLSANRLLSLANETKNLLKKLDRPVTITVNIGPQDPQAPKIRAMMDSYIQASDGRLTVTFINPQTQTEPGEKGPRLVQPNVAKIEAEGFLENVSPVSEETLNGALSRLLNSEYHLIYFLHTFGEKIGQNSGHGGLSQWAEDLASRRVTALDYYWADGAPLPREASALVLAGPRAPLGEEREAALINFLKNGGRVLIMADPFVVSLSRDFWSKFGLDIPDGLVIDPETNLAGTKEAFVVASDYLSHPLTSGLTGPMVWPVAGAFAPLAETSPTQLTKKVYGLVESSPSSWLETDPSSYVANEVRYQLGVDTPGPLVLAVAAEIEGGGRMVALSDSDLAANGYRGFPANRNFTSAAINWLLSGEAGPLMVKTEAQGLVLNHISARLIFWLPVVVWPVSVMVLWLIHYYHRRRRWG